MLGQPNLDSTTLESRCADPNARFNYANDGGFEMFGPVGVAVGPDNRLFVTDYGGRRVMSWPNASALEACQPADVVFGVGQLAGPEAVTVDGRGRVYVSDTLSHSILIYEPDGAGGYAVKARLGKAGTKGSSMSRFHFQRGVAFAKGRLFVADDYNKRVLIFDAPFRSGERAVDSIGASANGGFADPKAVATSGRHLFVADYSKSRVLRFSGPFNTPNQVYKASGRFRGVANPVDLDVGPDKTLFVSDPGKDRVHAYKNATTETGRPDFSLAGVGPTPLGVFATAAGLFVADYEQFRVRIFEG